MEAKANYTVVGLIVLILTGALLSVGLWLSVGFNQKVYTIYSVYLKEAAAGLSEESPVKYNGVQVGYVKAIRLTKNDPRQVQLLLDIEEGTPITTSTVATLISQGITGNTYVGLSAASSDLTPLLRMPGEPYPVIPARPSLFNQIDSILREVSDNVTKVSDQIKRVFNKQNAQYIRNILANTERISGAFAQNTKELDHTLKNADVLIGNLTKASKDFPEITKGMKQASTNVSKAMVSGKSAIDGITPELNALMHKLNAISANMEKVSSEMRQNPSVVIRGTTPPKPGPGE